MLSQGVAALADRIKNDINGILVLKRWLGDGAQPCQPDEAELRAKTCSGCVYNVSSHSIESSIAAEILRQEKVRLQLDLTTAHDEEINTCSLCGCYLKLKVWVPMQYITAPKKKLPKHCWQSTLSKQ